MDKLKMQTKNLASENYEKLAVLFPNAVTESTDENGNVVRAIDKDILMQEINCKVVEGREERYQFTWPDKKQAILTANAPINKTLRPCREESVNFDTTENLYIEGDNLEVLKLLQETYLGKIKMIYIDPPYNTGNDFVYEDDFAQNADDYIANSGQLDGEGNRLVANTESNGRFHTDWLNMMYPRLKLARDLLSEDGVIFISIDDNEGHNLKKICDEVFGECNNLINCVWINGRTSAAHFIKSHEYIMGYAKNIHLLPLFAYNGDNSISDRTIKKPGTKNPLSDIEFPAGLEFECGDKVFPNKFGQNEPVEVVKGIFECKDGKLKNPVTIRAAWAMADMIKNWLKGEKVIDQKGQLVKRFFFKSNGVLQYEKVKGTVHPSSVIQNISTKSGTSELENLFDKSIFPFPKSTELIKYLMPMVNKSDLILDFFSGSATTAHAVMQLNAEDGGKRKFIMVQLPEITDEKSEAYKAGFKNICEIGKERIRRAGNQFLVKDTRGGGTGDAPSSLDIGFRVLKIDSSNMQDVYYSPENVHKQDLFQDNVKPDRTAEDLLFQVMLDLGVQLSSKIETKKVNEKTVYFVNDNYLVACFDQDITEETITQIAKEKPYYFIMRDSGFASDSVATNFEQIFTTYSADTVRKVL